MSNVRVGAWVGGVWWHEPWVVVRIGGMHVEVGLAQYGCCVLYDEAEWVRYGYLSMLFRFASQQQHWCQQHV